MSQVGGLSFWCGKILGRSGIVSPWHLVTPEWGSIGYLCLRDSKGSNSLSYFSSLVLYRDLVCLRPASASQGFQETVSTLEVCGGVSQAHCWTEHFSVYMLSMLIGLWWRTMSTARWERQMLTTWSTENLRACSYQSPVARNVSYVRAIPGILWSINDRAGGSMFGPYIIRLLVRTSVFSNGDCLIFSDEWEYFYWSYRHSLWHLDWSRLSGPCMFNCMHLQSKLIYKLFKKRLSLYKAQI